MTSKPLRGYVFSRPMADCQRTPQHIQNMVIREYVNKNGYEYLLSMTEYKMDNCYLILEQTLDNLNDVTGICLYSMMMLPDDESYRQNIFDRILSDGKELHCAVEGLKLCTPHDKIKWDNILRTIKITNMINAPEIEKWLI